MGIVAWIILGLVAGYIASVIMKTNSEQGALGDILLGVVGALVGGFLFSMFGGTGLTGFNIYSLVVAVIGSVLLIGVRRAL